jgi:protein-S-isoprenylcysteine O-methyltransferase Ste14
MPLWKVIRSLILPVTVTIFVPVLIGVLAGLRSVDAPAPMRWTLLVLGCGTIVGGLVLMVWTNSLFHRVGRGTLAPWDETSRLVVRGPYRHVRNPMISGVLAILLGEAIAARSWPLLLWFAAFFTMNALVIPSWEEPNLERRFGSDYAEYRRHVPRWIPRLRSWEPSRARERA